MLRLSSNLFVQSFGIATMRNNRPCPLSQHKISVCECVGERVLAVCNHVTCDVFLYSRLCELFFPPISCFACCIFGLTVHSHCLSQQHRSIMADILNLPHSAVSDLARHNWGTLIKNVVKSFMENTAILCSGRCVMGPHPQLFFIQTVC